MKELSNGILDFNGKSSDNRECSFSLFVGEVHRRFSENSFLKSSFLDFALQCNISNVNRLILVDIFI
jgi:hypothetical protein